MTIPYVILLLVGLQRLAELIYARRNTGRLLAAGGREIGAGHYPLFVVLHAAWLVTLFLRTNDGTPVIWPLVAGFLGLQCARIWVIASLGRFWTTRIITLEDAPLVRHGPYRFVRHPNYLIVALEIPLLPLAFGDWQTAAVFTVLNGALLLWRIRLENDGLDARRMLSSDHQVSEDTCARRAKGGAAERT